ncbi:hypothetical protein K502DRAFT_324654, partial [Neoconidiobolus thromboides FSU 785]
MKEEELSLEKLSSLLEEYKKSLSYKDAQEVDKKYKQIADEQNNETNSDIRMYNDYKKDNDDKKNRKEKKGQGKGKGNEAMTPNRSLLPDSANLNKTETPSLNKTDTPYDMNETEVQYAPAINRNQPLYIRFLGWPYALSSQTASQILDGKKVEQLPMTQLVGTEGS